MLDNEIRETVEFTTEDAWLDQRLADVTSTEISSLFGCSPYETEFALWSRKANREHAPYVENERTLWGKRLQDTIALGIAEDNGWKIRPVTEYMRLPRLRLGSSFDFEIEDLDGEGPAILEIKNVDFLQWSKKWDVNDETGYIEGPPHIEFQVQQQMLIRQRQRAVIGVFVGGNKPIILRRDALPDVQIEIVAAARRFWSNVDSRTEPVIDYDRDWAQVIAMNTHVSGKSIVEIEEGEEFDDLCEVYRDMSEKMAAMKLVRDVCRAKLMKRLGENKYGLSKKFRLTSWEIGEAVIQVHRKPQRRIKVTKLTGAA